MKTRRLSYFGTTGFGFTCWWKGCVRSLLLFVLAASAATLTAQEESDDEFLRKMANGTPDPSKPMEAPEAIDPEVEDGIRFYFTALEPAGDLELFVREGNSPIPIRPAYDTFGSLHQLSKRTSLTFYQKITEENEDGNEETRLVPAFRVACGSEVFLVIYDGSLKGLIGGEQAPTLPTVALSTDTFPFGRLSVFNPFNEPLLIKMDGTTTSIPPRKVHQHPYTIDRPGAGYVAISLFQQGESQLEKLLDTRIGVFDKSRAIALPYVASNGEGTGLLVHREMPQAQQVTE